MSAKPFGHSVRVLRTVRLAQRGPLDPQSRQEVIQIKRRGGRKGIERAAHLVRGFVRIEGEIEEYTAEEWVRVFGTGNERGTSHGRIEL